MLRARCCSLRLQYQGFAFPTLRLTQLPLLLVLALGLSLVPSKVLAGGVNFTWSHLCYTEAPVSEITFACNVNTTTVAFQWPMTMSFKIDAEMTDMVGVEITVEGQSDATDLPDWWKLGPTDCRPNQMTFSTDKTGVATEVCQDWTDGTAFNVFAYTWDTNRAHVSAGAAIDASIPFDMLPNQEYYVGELLLKNSKTVGTGSCAGCSIGMVWGLKLLTIAGLDGRRDDLTEPLPSGNQCLKWNNPTVATCGDVVIRPAISTILSLYSAPNPSAYLRPVTLTATISPSEAAGTVVFKDGPYQLGLSSLSGGTAALSTTALSEGTHALTAVYQGRGNYQPSTSPAVSHTVLHRAPTSVLMSSEPDSSALWRPVTLSAQVDPASATGTVVFRDEGVVLGTAGLEAGSASLVASFSTEGEHALTATYSGDTTYAPSTSPEWAHTVLTRPIPAVTIASTPDSTIVGHAVVLSAQVSPSTATGAITFHDGATSLGTMALTLGATSLVTSFQSEGTHLLMASYSGDSSFSPAVSPSRPHVALPKLTPSVVVSSAPNPSLVNHAIQITAIVSPAAASGTVTFRDGASLLGTAPLSGGTAALTTSVLGIGSHPLTAVYGGDSTYAATNSVTHTHVVQPLIATTTALLSSLNPSALDDSVEFVARVSPGTATGMVSFYRSGIGTGTAPLSGGEARFRAGGFCGGEHSMVATYPGDVDHAGSTSSTIVQAVLPAPTSVLVGTSPNPSFYTQTVTLTATVSDYSTGSCPRSGTVQFMLDGAAFGSPVALSGGTARISSISSLTVGSHAFSAYYTGNASFLPSNSNAYTHEVASPRPAIVGVRDVANDEGGQVKLLWNASNLDLPPYQRIESYWILRSVPATAVARARQAGALVLDGPSATADARIGSLLPLERNGITYYWEYVASQPAFHVTDYSYVASTTGDSLAGSNPYTAFMIQARTAGGTEWWFSAPDSGYSVDNLAPGTPGGFTAGEIGGTVVLKWLPSPEPDLASYRLHRGPGVDFEPNQYNLVVEQATTAFHDYALGPRVYKLCAVDVHGNRSQYAIAVPPGVTGSGSESLVLALESVKPNPSIGGRVSAVFTLPSTAPARLEMMDVGGRRVDEQEVGQLGPGRHTVEVGGGLAPGLYFVRLVQGATARVARVGVLN